MAVSFDLVAFTVDVYLTHSIKINRKHVNPMPRIKSGIFIMPFHHPSKPIAQAYDEDMEFVIRADELGFDEFWIGEHHTMAYENMPMPELFIAAGDA